MLRQNERRPTVEQRNDGTRSEWVDDDRSRRLYYSNGSPSQKDRLTLGSCVHSFVIPVRRHTGITTTTCTLGEYSDAAVVSEKICNCLAI